MDHSQLPEQGSEGTGYYVPQEEASTLTTQQQFFHLRNMQDISMATAEDFSCHNQFHSIGNHFVATSGISEQSMKRDASSMETATHDKDVHKRSRLETCGINDQNISAFNEEGSMDLDSEMDITETSSLITLSKSRLTGINPSSLSENQIFQGHNYTGNASCNYEQNKALDINIFQNEIAAGKSSLPESSKVNSICSLEDMQALPGPSGLCENIPQLNFDPSEKLRYTSSQQGPSMCFFCEKKISDHWVSRDGTQFYKCCMCQSLFKDNNGHICLDRRLVSSSETSSDSSGET